MTQLTTEQIIQFLGEYYERNKQRIDTINDIDKWNNEYNSCSDIDTDAPESNIKTSRRFRIRNN